MDMALNGMHPLTAGTSQPYASIQMELIAFRGLTAKCVPCVTQAAFFCQRICYIDGSQNVTQLLNSLFIVEV